ncbi:rano class II histocompatibility antigen, A beta chain-like [Menidia menidia]
MRYPCYKWKGTRATRGSFFSLGLPHLADYRFAFDMRSFKSLLFLCVFSTSAVDCSSDGGGYFMFADFWCAAPSRDPGEVVYLVDWYFGGELTMRYNSTAGNWTGLTAAGRLTAGAFNQDEHDVLQRRLEKMLICVDHVDQLYNATEENTAEPSVVLQALGRPPGRDPVLACSAYDFYPKNIKLTWLLNGREVGEGVTGGAPTSNEDWTYQVHSYLELRPRPQDRITCVVEHASLMEPKIYQWESSLDWSDWGYVAGGVGALVLGASVLCVGAVRYRGKSCQPQMSNVL